MSGPCRETRGNFEPSKTLGVPLCARPQAPFGGNGTASCGAPGVGQRKQSARASQYFMKKTERNYTAVPAETLASGSLKNSAIPRSVESHYARAPESRGFRSSE